MPRSKSVAQLDREINACLASETPALGAVLGKTASGKVVKAPARMGAPDTNDALVFRKTKAKFEGWTKHDHMDAARLLDAASSSASAAGNGRLAQTLSRWSSVHWDIGGRWTTPEQDARSAALLSD